MREIKFRAWKKKNKVMRLLCDTFYWIQISVNKFNKSEMSFFATSGYPNKEVLASTIDGDIFMQFTGLKDKQGKEIYEGDIIEWISVGKEGGNKEDIGKKRDMGRYEVVFKDGKFTITKPEITIGNFERNEIEIIGNIYKNPELLKEVK